MFTMCEYCRYGVGHHPRCPEADELMSLHECVECWAEIYEGETYYHVGELIYCEDCMFAFRKLAEREN